MIFSAMMDQREQTHPNKKRWIKLVFIDFPASYYNIIEALWKI